MCPYSFCCIGQDTADRAMCKHCTWICVILEHPITSLLLITQFSDFFLKLNANPYLKFSYCILQYWEIRKQHDYVLCLFINYTKNNFFFYNRSTECLSEMYCVSKPPINSLSHYDVVFIMQTKLCNLIANIFHTSQI